MTVPKLPDVTSDDSSKSKPQTLPNDWDQTGIGLGGPEEELTDEGLDELISEEDPDFLQQLKKLAADKNLSIADIDMDGVDEALLAEKERWQNGPRLMRVAAVWLPFLPNLSLGVRRFAVFIEVILSFSTLKIQKFFKFLVTGGKDKLILWIKEKYQQYSAWKEQRDRHFSKMTAQRKLAMYGLIALGIVTVTYFVMISKYSLIQKDEPLFLTSFEGVAEQKFEFDPKTDEPFYENLRIGSHMLHFPKMVVNIKKSANSGDNPMVAVEFYIEGFSQEVVIELKDREPEFRDDIQRNLEDFSFDQLDSPAGKQLLQETLRLNLNRKLSTGRVKRVLIKTFVIKD
jgi:flagellar basal body-associated protein FliL